MKTPVSGVAVQEQLRLVGINMPEPVTLFITENEQIIGSADECRVPLKLNGVSRRHLSISGMKNNGFVSYYMIDLKSKNGTKLNGTPLQPGVRYPLKAGDMVTLAGRYDFKAC